MKKSSINTKLGSMVVVSDDRGLYLLEFHDKQALGKELQKLHKRTGIDIMPGRTEHIDSIEDELKSYFNGTLREFKTPLHISGTEFQKLVWKQLMRVPFGKTKSYMEQAEAIGKSKAYRAVANANAANQFCIIIPCHRIINSNGKLGGYAGGIERKQFLLDHEKSC
jgi:AraC family transcriptional regulator of adaptative response/methylated-DNA-[protein]-cysteine methyltransferase